MEYYPPNDFRASSSEEELSPEANDMEYVTMEDMGASGGRPEPTTRGVKKTPSLRQGAAGFAELLEIAITASNESQRDAQRTPADPPVMPVGGGGLMTSPSHKNKRTRCHPAIRSRKSTQRGYPPSAHGSPLQPDRSFLG